MGFTAPGTSDQLSIYITALSSYSNPFILLAVFISAFLIAYVFSKKNLVIAFSAALISFLLVASYLASAYSSQIRY